MSMIKNHIMKYNFISFQSSFAEVNGQDITQKEKEHYSVYLSSLKDITNYIRAGFIRKNNCHINRINILK